MTFPILGGNGAGAVAGYQIDNSLRFNDGDSAYLNRTPSSATNRKTFTWSGWVKRSDLHIFFFFGAGQLESDEANLGFNGSHQIQYFDRTGGTTVDQQLETTQVFRDISAWYHIVLAIDTTQATSSNRAKLYVNGEQITDFGTENYAIQNYESQYNTSTIHYLGRRGHNPSYLDGYLAEVNFIDGQQLSPTDFGEFDSNSGIWKPIEYTGTYGTNGFYLDFENSGSLGADQSGNSNNFTPYNLASTDQTTDTPTNNFATLNSLTPVVTHTLSEANLKSTNSSGTHGGATATISYPTSGKWYHEVRINAEDSSKGQGVAIGNQIYRSSTDWGNYANLIGYFSDGTKQTDAGYSSYGVVHNAGDIIGVAYNADDQELTFYHDNSSQGTITTSEMDGTIDFNNLCPIVFGRNMGQTFNFGQDSSFAGAETRQNNSDGNGYGDFYYAPPSGYLALCTQNLATALSPTIDDGSEYFNSVLYTGNASDRTISGVGFQPDWVWIKNRSGNYNHGLFDSNRGATLRLSSSTSGTEITYTESLTAFNSDGFDLGDNSDGNNTVNNNNENYVAWNWKANAGTTSSNTDGSITSTVQANTTAGFSVVTFTGNGSNDATIGHGLGTTPAMIITKNRDDSVLWRVFHKDLTSTNTLFLNVDFAQTAPSGHSNGYIKTVGSSTYSVYQGNVDTNGVNGSGDDMIAYCFAEIEGYSKMGSYQGNGNADGTFVYTGFRPAWVMIKKTSGSANWFLYDTKRNPHNLVVNRLIANGSEAENTGSGDDIDILSNGWKARASASALNGNGDSFIYLAFAENPFVTSGAVPVTAR
jgi:hypothetical protein